MDLKQVCKWTVITGTILIWSIKWIIRPLGTDETSVRYLLNIAPNLFGSFLIPFAAYWIFSGRDHLLARVFRISSPFEVRLVCLLGFGMLVVNEYLQRIPFFGRTFDYNDIAFSSVGLIISCLVFGKIRTAKEAYEVQVS